MGLPPRTKPVRGRGEWVATVPGLGRLAVVHHSRTDFRTLTYRDPFEGIQPQSARLRAFRQALVDNPGRVLMQRDKPKRKTTDPLDSDGYIDVWEIGEPDWEEDGSLSFKFIGRLKMRF